MPKKIEDITTPYFGYDFQLDLLDSWQDETTHILSGPVSDKVRHNIILQEYENETGHTLDAYTLIQIEWLSALLPDFKLLRNDNITLDVGLTANRVIYGWTTEEERWLYQEQLYVLFEEKAYHLTATFSKKTRKMFGKEVEILMRGFIPGSYGLPVETP